MRTRVALIALGLIGAAAVALAISGILAPSSTERLPFRNVTAQYPDLNYPKRALFVFRDRARLDEHLAERSGRLGPRPGEVKLPRVDFEREMLIVVAMGARSSTGYALRLRNVERKGNTTLVNVREISPTEKEIVAPAITYPYLALVGPRQDGRTQLRLSGES